MDKLTPQQRHNTMASIRGKNTKPELIVRRGLWKRGFRYRLNHKRLPGHPDLVLRKYRTCIFVNGCFWHGHLVELSKMESSACCKIPATNHDFWVAKIRRNKEQSVKKPFICAYNKVIFLFEETFSQEIRIFAGD